MFVKASGESLVQPEPIPLGVPKFCSFPNLFPTCLPKDNTSVTLDFALVAVKTWLIHKFSNQEELADVRWKNTVHSAVKGFFWQIVLYSKAYESNDHETKWWNVRNLIFYRMVLPRADLRARRSARAPLKLEKPETWKLDILNVDMLVSQNHHMHRYDTVELLVDALRVWKLNKQQHTTMILWSHANSMHNKILIIFRKNWVFWIFRKNREFQPKLLIIAEYNYFNRALTATSAESRMPEVLFFGEQVGNRMGKLQNLGTPSGIGSGWSEESPDAFTGHNAV